ERIAGVSSFGWSGTNAHLVLEEALQQTAQDTRRSLHLLVLSAKTEAALEQNTDNLVAYLSSHPKVPFADVIYTLQAGRSRLHARRMLLCENKEEAISALTNRDPKSLINSIRNGQAVSNRPVAFLFPGLGERYVEVIQALYKEEVSFRKTVDISCTFLKDQLGLDLSTLFSQRALNGASPHMVTSITKETSKLTSSNAYQLM